MPNNLADRPSWDFTLPTAKPALSVRGATNDPSELYRGSMTDFHYRHPNGIWYIRAWTTLTTCATDGWYTSPTPMGRISAGRMPDRSPFSWSGPLPPEATWIVNIMQVAVEERPNFPPLALGWWADESDMELVVTKILPYLVLLNADLRGRLVANPKDDYCPGSCVWAIRNWRDMIMRA